MSNSRWGRGVGGHTGGYYNVPTSLFVLKFAYSLKM